MLLSQNSALISFFLTVDACSGLKRNLLLAGFVNAEAAESVEGVENVAVSHLSLSFAHRISISEFIPSLHFRNVKGVSFS